MTFHPDASRAKGRPVLRPIAAYCAAAVAAGLAMGLVGVPFAAPLTFLESLAGGTMFGLMMTPYIAIFAFLPSMAALGAVRALRLRRGVTDTIAGGVIGALMITVIHQLGSAGFQFDLEDLFSAFRYGLAGLVGGFIYWRTNGQPQPRRRSDPGGPAAAAANQS